MKTSYRILVGILCTAIMSPVGAVTIKKAAPVSSSTVATSSSGATASLLPTVVGLVGGISALTKQTRALSAECEPTTQEINFVDATVKEWAKTGTSNANDIESYMRTLGRRPCDSANGYEVSVRLNAAADGDICYNWYGDEEKENVWYRYPRVGRAIYCPDGTVGTNCPKERQTASDIYEIFNLVDFTVNDYTPTEATMAAKLLDKVEKCSSAKLSAKKRAMWGEFLTDTVSNMGQKTNTGAIMQQVQGLTGGGLQSLGGIAQQFLDR